MKGGGGGCGLALNSPVTLKAEARRVSRLMQTSTAVSVGEERSVSGDKRPESVIRIPIHPDTVEVLSSNGLIADDF